MDDVLWNRFMAKVLVDPSGCWLWQAHKLKGYGTFHAGTRGMVYAHRYAYERLVGPIPGGLTIDHLCRVPACVNPAHLEPVTQSENRKRVPLKTHCPHGHPYSGDNVLRKKDGSRACRTCKNEGRRNPNGLHSPYKTHCINGHERNEANTYRKKDGRRECRVCHRELERIRCTSKQRGY